MKTGKTFLMAFDSILKNKMRSFLTMLGILIGVMAVITLVSVMDGVTGEVTDIFENMGTNIVTVNITGRGGNRSVTPEDFYSLTEEHPDLISMISPSVTVSGTVRARYATDTLKSSVKGVSEDYQEIGKIETQNGRFLSYIDIAARNKICVVGSYLNSEIFNNNAVGQTVKINNEIFEIVGVLKEISDSSEGTSDDSIYIPYTSALKLNNSSVVTSYSIAAANDNVVEKAVDVIKEMLLDIFEYEDFYSVISMKELLSQFNSIIDTLKAALVCIAGISLLVGGVGIMNIMLVSVTERTREIGIRKSLGAKRRDILSQFVIEAGVISSLGGLIGILLGAALSFIAGKALSLTITPTFSAVFVAFSVSVAIGIIFGFLPAKKAAKLNPIDALRYE